METKKHFKFFITVILMVLISASCDIANHEETGNIPTVPLFRTEDTRHLSLRSGNLYYGGFVASDFNNIYYRSRENTRLFKANYDGTQPVSISDIPPYYINVVGDMVFFLDDPEQGRIYKVNRYGEGEAMVLDIKASYLLVDFGFILYIDSYDGFVYRVLHDGSEKTKILDEEISNIQMFDEKIYFVFDNIYTDGTTGVLEISISDLADISTARDIENSHTNFYEIEPGFSYFAPGEEYFFFFDSKNNLISMEKDNLRKRKVFDGEKTNRPVVVSGNHLYYINSKDKNRLYRMSLNDFSRQNVVVDDMVYRFSVCGNRVYYSRPDNRDIYTVSVSGGFSSKIT